MCRRRVSAQRRSDRADVMGESKADTGPVLNTARGLQRPPIGRASRIPGGGPAHIKGDRETWLVDVAATPRGVILDAFRQRASAAGHDVVMDRCVKIEHARFHRGLHYAGFNTGVITSRRRVT